jgi:hypothetical protein
MAGRASQAPRQWPARVPRRAGQLLVALDAAELVLGGQHSRGGPPQRHLARAPALHPAGRTPPASAPGPAGVPTARPAARRSPARTGATPPTCWSHKPGRGPAGRQARQHPGHDASASRSVEVNAVWDSSWTSWPSAPVPRTRAGEPQPSPAKGDRARLAAVPHRGAGGVVLALGPASSTTSTSISSAMTSRPTAVEAASSPGSCARRRRPGARPPSRPATAAAQPCWHQPAEAGSDQRPSGGRGASVGVLHASPRPTDLVVPAACHVRRSGEDPTSNPTDLGTTSGMAATLEADRGYSSRRSAVERRPGVRQLRREPSGRHPQVLPARGLPAAQAGQGRGRSRNLFRTNHPIPAR